MAIASMDTNNRSKTHKAPNPVWTLLEGRSVFELGSFYATRRLLKRLPKGDGHPVIVFPGFLTSERSTRPLRGLLRDLNYQPYDWGLGRNLRFNKQREAKMQLLLKKTFLKHGRKVSLIGWSLGGVFAREIAKANPEFVRFVVTLGSPITGPRHAAAARPLFELINGKPEPETEIRLANLHTPPPVPCTSIYTKTDGIVHWHGSMQDDVPHAENIEVPASHCGLGVNPLVMYIIADRLKQKEDDWSRFNTRGMRRFIYNTRFEDSRDLDRYK